MSRAPGLRRALLASALLVGCRSGGTWSGAIYEERAERANLKKRHTMGDFASLDACRAACLSLIRERECPGDGCWSDPDYECGLECQPNGYGLNLCQRTER